MTRIADDMKPAAPDALDAGLRERILMAAPSPTGTARRPPPRLAGVAWAGGVAAVAALAVVFAAGGHHSYDKLNTAASAPMMSHSATPPQPGQASPQSMVLLQKSLRDEQAAQNQAVARSTADASQVPAAAPPPDATASGGPPSSPGLDVSGVRRVHKAASIAIRTDDPEAAAAKIDQMVSGAGGFVGDSDLSTDGGGKTLHVTLKVPVQQFETILSGIAGLGEVQAKHLQGEDITKSVSDADARDAELEQEMQDAQRRLAARRNKMDWRTEEWMRDLKIQLAQSRADLKAQRGLAELGDIDLTITSKQTVQTGFWAGFGTSGRDAAESLTQSLGILAAAVVWVLVYAPIWLPIVLVGRWTWTIYARRVEAAGGHRA